MNWESLGKLALVVAVVAAQYPAVRRQWLEDRAGAIKTMRLLVYYFLYIAVGLAVLLGAFHEGGASPAQAVAAGGFLLGWVLLGASWLIKLVPKYKPVAAWLLKPVGILDVIALAMIAVSLAVLLA